MYYTWTFPVKAISKDNEKIFNRQGRFFLSKRFKDFEKLLQCLFLERKRPGFELLLGELKVDILFRFKTRVHSDLFNLPKSVCDAFNGYIWKDDRQIKDGVLRIEYGDKEEIVLMVSDIPRTFGGILRG